MNTHSHRFDATFDVRAQRPADKAMIRLRLAALLGIGDVGAIVGAHLGVQAAIGASAPAHGTFLFAAILPVYVLCAFMVRAYAAGLALMAGESLVRALLALAVCSAVLVPMILALGVGTPAERFGIVAGQILAGFLMAGLRKAHVGYASHRLGGSLQSVVELYDGPPPNGYRQGGWLDTSRFFDPAKPDPFSLDQLARAIGRTDRVVVHCRAERRSAWAHALQGMNVHAEVVADEWAEFRPIGIASHRGDATLVVASGPLSLHQRLLKRVFDIAFAVAVLIGLAPMLIVVAIAIKLDSPGPVLFRQPRIGRQNSLFSVFKFRSMRADCCDPAGHLSTTRDDPRTTRIGRFIRQTSIDELPQFINVLLGDMSVVGPRPHAISSTAEARLFWEVDQRYWHRHACRPGLTGLAQIQGYRGATNCAKDLTDRVDADLQYLRAWSFWSDMAIIIKTFRAVVYSPNAY